MTGKHQWRFAKSVTVGQRIRQRPLLNHGLVQQPLGLRLPTPSALIISHSWSKIWKRVWISQIETKWSSQRPPANVTNIETRQRDEYRKSPAWELISRQYRRNFIFEHKVMATWIERFSSLKCLDTCFLGFGPESSSFFWLSSGWLLTPAVMVGLLWISQGLARRVGSDTLSSRA